MVARLPAPQPRLLVSLFRQGESPVHVTVNGYRAARTAAVNLLLQAEDLKAGDVLRVSSDRE